MYNKTNVNSKCSMRITKGCKGQALLASLPPTARTNQPQNQAPQPFPMQLDGPFRRGNETL